jgi:hypothetical protein
LAPVSFSFADAEATSILRQEAVRDVGLVRCLDRKQITQIGQEIENELRAYPAWRDKLPTATFEDIYRCKESIQAALQKIHFVDERTFRKMEEIGLPQEGFLIDSFENLEQQGFLSSRDWEGVHALAVSPDLPSDPVYQYVSELFAQKAWIFREDLSARNKIRQEVKESVPLKQTYVEIGTWVIQVGEKVTKRHVEMMREIKKVLMKNENLLTLSTLTGSFIQALIFTVLIVLYLRMQSLEVLYSFRRIALIGTIIMLSLILAKVAEFVILNKAGSFVDVFCYPIVILFGALLTCLLLGMRTSFIISIFLAVVLGITLAVKYDYFLVMNLAASLVGILSVRKIRRRKRFLRYVPRFGLLSFQSSWDLIFFKINSGPFSLLGKYLRHLFSSVLQPSL